MDRNTLAKLWRDPMLRRHFSEGMTTDIPVLWLVAVGAACGLVLLPLGLPVWFGVECLFGDRFIWPFDFDACRPLPPFSTPGWFGTMAWFAFIGAGYLLIFRISLRRGWRLSHPLATVHAGHLFTVVMSVVTGWLIARVYTSPAFTLSELAVTVTAGPVWLRLWWSMRMVCYVRIAARRPEIAATSTPREYFKRQFALSSPGTVDVRLDPTTGSGNEGPPFDVVVMGPFDAVDELRLQDLVRTVFDGVVREAVVETTLSEDAYWLPYTEELGPSGYVSPPIPPPLVIPRPVIAAFGLLVVAFFAWAFFAGEPFSIDASRLSESAGSIDATVRQMEAGFDPDMATGIATNFYLINLADSKAACPSLSRDVMNRWHVWNERHDDRYVYRVHRVSQLDYYGYAIDGYSRTCVREELGTHLRDAQYRIAPTLSAHEWVEIPGDKDWRYVPPRTSPRDPVWR